MAGLPSRVATFGAIAGLVLAAAGGVLGGMRIAERANEPGVQTVPVTAPRSAGASDLALRSAAGFTGFEEHALGGRVTRTGTTSASADGVFEVQSGPSAMTIQTSSPVRLFRIEGASQPLAPGDVVVVRLDEAGNPLAVLRLPGDLREGDAR